MPEPSSYYQPRTSTTTLAGQNIRVIFKSGMPNGNRVTPAQGLLAEAAQLADLTKVFLMSTSPGAVAVALARQVGAGELTILSDHALASKMTEQTLQANGIQNARLHPAVSLLPEYASAFEAILIDLPKGRKLARRWLVEAFTLLKPGGSLYLAGSNTTGIQAVIHDAEALFGKACLLAYRKGSRVAKWMNEAVGEIKHLPTWFSEPGIASSTWYEFILNTGGEEFHIQSLPGVFSYDRLDEGTAMLLDHFVVPADGCVLDLGCGYGVLGMWAARRGALQVDLCDVNRYAVACAQANLHNNAILNARVYSGDVLDWVTDQRYDLVVSNPPFHSGKEVDYAMANAFITGSHQVLNPKGRLVIVANRFIRYDRLLQDTFGNANVLAQTGKYHVLEAIAR